MKPRDLTDMFRSGEYVRYSRDLKDQFGIVMNDFYRHKTDLVGVVVSKRSASDKDFCLNRGAIMYARSLERNGRANQCYVVLLDCDGRTVVAQQTVCNVLKSIGKAPWRAGLDGSEYIWLDEDFLPSSPWTYKVEPL